MNKNARDFIQANHDGQLPPILVVVEIEHLPTVSGPVHALGCLHVQLVLLIPDEAPPLSITGVQILICLRRRLVEVTPLHTAHSLRTLSN